MQSSAFPQERGIVNPHVPLLAAGERSKKPVFFEKTGFWSSAACQASRRGRRLQRSHVNSGYPFHRNRIRLCRTSLPKGQDTGSSMQVFAPSRFDLKGALQNVIVIGLSGCVEPRQARMSALQTANPQPKRIIPNRAKFATIPCAWLRTKDEPIAPLAHRLGRTRSAAA